MPRTQDYDDMRVDELREKARSMGMTGIWKMRKAELVEALQSSGRRGGAGRGQAKTKTGPSRSRSSTQARSASGPSTGRSSSRTGRARNGASLTTKDHDTIRTWADRRGGVPATVPGTEHGDHLGVLRIDFPGYGGDNLQEVSWDEWFATFDSRNLDFVYQERKKDGAESNFFRLTNPNGKDG